jgi:hypothetical protein
MSDDIPKLLRAIARGTQAQENKHDVILDAAADEIERLREVLREIRRDIIECADDTIWMRGGIETVCDRITAILGDENPPSANSPKSAF